MEILCSEAGEFILKTAESSFSKQQKGFHKKILSCQVEEILHLVHCQVAPLDSGIPAILKYLLSLKSWDYPLVCCTCIWQWSISAFHPLTDNCLIFTHPTTARFLKGLVQTFPPVSTLIPNWDLSLILSARMNLPFKPLASCVFPYLSMESSLPNGNYFCLETREACDAYGRHSLCDVHRDKSVPKVTSQVHHRGFLRIPLESGQTSTGVPHKTSCH